MPTNSTSARSCSSPGPSTALPMNRMAATGSSAMSEVLIDLIRVWFSARLAAWL